MFFIRNAVCLSIKKLAEGSQVHGAQSAHIFVTTKHKRIGDNPKIQHEKDMKLDESSWQQ